jgi:hypothetical protein
VPEVRFDESNIFEVESYLHHQATSWFSASMQIRIFYITRAMDLHDVGYGRGSVKEVLGSSKVPALCVGISSETCINSCNLPPGQASTAIWRSQSSSARGCRRADFLIRFGLRAWPARWTRRYKR